MSDKTKILIGIDPDCDKSGFALYDPKAKQIMTLQTFDFFDLMEELNLHDQLYDLTVHLEAGWLIKGNWHKGGSKKSGNSVGRNHEIGRQIEKFLKRQNIAYKLVEPQGYSSYTHELFCAVTGWKLKTNAETRVAGLLVFGY